MEGKYDVRGDSFADAYNKVIKSVPEGYEIVECSIKLVNRKYIASYTMKQSLINKIRALKDQYESTRRNPTMNAYLLDEIIRELEK